MNLVIKFFLLYFLQILFCSDAAKVDGGLSEWQKWQECVIKNGKCLRTRSRYCDNPVPAEGGDNCKGLNQEQRQCEAQICKVDSNELTLTPSGAMAELLKVFGSNIPPSEYKSNVQEIAGGMKLSDSSINTFHWFGWRSEKFSGREARLTATFMFFNTVPVNSDSFGFRIGSGEIKNDFLRSCMVEQGCNASYTLKFESSNQVLFEFIHGKQTQNFQVTGFKLEFLPVSAAEISSINWKDATSVSTATATCSSHQVFASSFVTKDFFIGDCISAAYKNCDLEKCFMLCCKHSCRSFGHSPAMLCVLNTCVVPEKTKKKESSLGNTFQYLW